METYELEEAAVWASDKPGRMVIARLSNGTEFAFDAANGEFPKITLLGSLLSAPEAKRRLVVSLADIIAIEFVNADLEM